MELHRKDLTVQGWPDYELIDSGDNRKLERYGSFILARPETQAIWKPRKPAEWKRLSAEFHWAEGKGSWQKKKNMPEAWDLSWADARFSIRLTSFKHTGVFPEQAANWMWLRERVSALESPAVLNLFGYTGIASVVAAKSGAQVTHVDASKQSNAWARDNAALSGLAPDAIRFLSDDALKFAERESRRGAKYDGIILDPPAFGRGPKGEVWRIEVGLPRLLQTLKGIFSNKPGSFFLLNGYAAGYSPQSLRQSAESIFKGQGEFGELQVQESNSERTVPSGIYIRFSA